MSIHDKLIDRLYDYLQICRECGNGALEDAAQAINEGRFDDLLGVREPTQKDVEAQILRAFGENSNVLANGGHVFRGGVLIEGVAYTHRASKTIVWVRDTAAAYAALRTYPDHKETET